MYGLPSVGVRHDLRTPGGAGASLDRVIGSRAARACPSTGGSARIRGQRGERLRSRAVAGETGEGLVVAVGGGFAAIRTADGERLAKLRRRLPEAPVVGDRVDLTLLEDGAARVDRVHERRSSLMRLQIMRTGERRGPQVLLANADVLVIVASIAEPPLRRGLVDRLLVAATLGRMAAALVLTKVDLAARATEAPEAVLADYASVGCAGVAVDARDPAAVRAAVLPLVRDRVAALAGHSGVGKSTVVNALTGGVQETGAISTSTTKGRHTTTGARFIDLPGGGALIDTPGIRSFALTDLDREDLEEGFPEIHAAAPDCRFRDCKHVGETGCAVAERVPAWRLDSYRKLLDELERGPEAWELP